MTDLVIRGRFGLGVARGAYSFEYERLMPGLDAWEAGQRMRETLPLLRQLWQGDAVADGDYYQFSATTCVPKPVQQNGPPVWAAARDPNSHEFAVRNGFSVQVTPLWQGLEEIESLMERFSNACERWSGARPKIMLLHHTYVAGDADDVVDAAAELSRFYNYFGAWFQNKRKVTQGRIEALDQHEIDSNSLMAPANMMRDLTIGTGKQVIEKIKRYEALGYDENAFWIDSGMSFERKKQSLMRFIDDVMPAFS